MVLDKLILKCTLKSKRPRRKGTYFRIMAVKTEVLAMEQSNEKIESFKTCLLICGSWIYDRRCIAGH